VEYTSAGFEGQAASDLRSAQKIARDDRSGHALATSMFLAQQSMEKLLKSIVLMLDEALNAGLGEKFYRTALGHTMYARPDRLYLRLLKGVGLPRGLDDRDALESVYPGFYDHVKGDLEFLEKFGARHDPKIFDLRAQSLLLQRSLGIRLPDSEIQELNSSAYRAFLAVPKENVVVLVSKYSDEDTGADMKSVIADGSLLEEQRRFYAGCDSCVFELGQNRKLFAMGKQNIGHILKGRREGALSRRETLQYIQVQMVAYALPSLAGFSCAYMRMLSLTLRLDATRKGSTTARRPPTYMPPGATMSFTGCLWWFRTTMPGYRLLAVA